MANNVQIIEMASKNFGMKVNTLENWSKEGFSVNKGVHPIGYVSELTDQAGLWVKGQKGKFYQKDKPLYSAEQVTKRPEKTAKTAQKGKKTVKVAAEKVGEKRTTAKAKKAQAPKKPAKVEKTNVQKYVDRNFEDVVNYIMTEECLDKIQAMMLKMAR